MSNCSGCTYYRKTFSGGRCDHDVTSHRFPVGCDHYRPKEVIDLSCFAGFFDEPNSPGLIERIEKSRAKEERRTTVNWKSREEIAAGINNKLQARAKANGRDNHDLAIMVEKNEISLEEATLKHKFHLERINHELENIKARKQLNEHREMINLRKTLRRIRFKHD